MKNAENESEIQINVEAETETPEAKAEQEAAIDEQEAAVFKQPDLEGRVAELEKMNALLNDQYLRKAADFDNYRKRMIKEKQDAIDFANTGLLVDLVQILDDFDRAIASGGVNEPGTPIAAFAEGITIIRNQLGSMLENKYGLAHYPVLGEHFDPHVHEAIGSIPSAEATEPTVLQEFVKGYKLKDRVIRVAKVMVSKPAESEA